VHQQARRLHQEPPQVEGDGERREWCVDPPPRASQCPELSCAAPLRRGGALSFARGHAAPCPRAPGAPRRFQRGRSARTGHCRPKHPVDDLLDLGLGSRDGPPDARGTAASASEGCASTVSTTPVFVGHQPPVRTRGGARAWTAPRSGRPGSGAVVAAAHAKRAAPRRPREEEPALAIVEGLRQRVALRSGQGGAAERLERRPNRAA